MPSIRAANTLCWWLAGYSQCCLLQPRPIVKRCPRSQTSNNNLECCNRLQFSPFQSLISVATTLTGQFSELLKTKQQLPFQIPPFLDCRSIFFGGEKRGQSVSSNHYNLLRNFRLYPIIQGCRYILVPSKTSLQKFASQFASQASNESCTFNKFHLLTITFQ